MTLRGVLVFFLRVDNLKIALLLFLVFVKFTLIIHVVLLDLVCTGIIRRPMPPPFVSIGTNSGPLERSNFMTSRSSDAMDASSTCR